MTYLYGMKYRGYSLGCQPMQGLLHRLDDPSNKYYDLLVYNRPLTDKEEQDFELEFIKEVFDE